MNRSSLAALAAFAGFALTLTLTGCGMGTSVFPDTPVASTAAKVPLGTINGNDFGGHAPIVGAHVFVLQATQAGYGAKVTSLLNSSYANSNYPTALDSTTGSPTNGWYYVTSDQSSNFSVSGDYSCAAGLPVYLYAAGGNPSSTGAVNITGATGTVDANNKTLITFSNSGTNLFYQGENITFATFSNGGSYNSFSGTTQVVSSINLTNSTFAVELGSNIGAIAQYSFTTTAAQSSNSSNPAIANMAMLGICPSGGSGTAVTITGASSIDDSNGKLLVTFTNSGTNGFSAGEQVTFAGVTGAYAAFSGTTQTINYQNLTSTTFSVELGPYGGNPGSGATGTATPTVGNFSSLKFVYMNEVSTAAMATAMAPFTAVSTSQNDAVHIGTSPTNLIGLQNAANNAAELYDIQGSQVGTGGDGDTHIAYASTPGITFYGTTTAGSAVITNVSTTAGMQVGYKVAGPGIPAGETISSIGTGTITMSTGTGVSASSSSILSAGGGFGTVPQALINTLGNILANCVDSANTYNGAYATSGTKSTQCTTLFTNATSDGTTTGTVPNDTGTAAINIARYPGGTTSNPSYVSNIYNGVTGNVPFQPNLSSAPHDYAVGITYLNPGGSSDAISDTEVDGSGDIWTVGIGSNAVYELLPSGVFNTYTPPSGSTVSTAFISGAAIAPDSSAVYVPAVAGMLKFTPGTFTGTLVTASNNANASQVAIDGTGTNLYVAQTHTNLLSGDAGPEASATLTKESVAGVAAGGNFPINSACTHLLQYVTLDNSNNVWTNNQNTSNNMICRFTSAGALSYSLAIPGSTFPLSYGGAVDAGGNFWFSEKDNSKLYKIASGTATTGNTTCNAGAGCTAATGGTISTPFATAVDGADNIWIFNSGTSPASVVEFSNSAVAITPTYLSGTGYGTNYLFLQVDQSGSLWGTSYTTASMVQYIGLATPAAQPLSYARANSKLGAKP
jgi:hypothetical protein